MARQNRRDIFDLNEVGAYHAVQRTVRRAWLCGLDPVSGRSFEHRRTWIQNRLQELAASFGIDCLSFAVMVNHVHVILRNRPDVVAGWSDEEVAKRWWQLFPLRKNKDKTPAIPKESELKMWMTPVRSKQLRTRLSDISWWMRALAERITRWSARHVGLVLCSFAVAIAYIAGLLTHSWRIHQEKARTYAELIRGDSNDRQARIAVDTLGLQVADRLQSIPGTDSLRQDVLADTLHYYETFIETANALHAWLQTSRKQD